MALFPRALGLTPSVWLGQHFAQGMHVEIGVLCDRTITLNLQRLPNHHRYQNLHIIDATKFVYFPADMGQQVPVWVGSRMTQSSITETVTILLTSESRR